MRRAGVWDSGRCFGASSGRTKRSLARVLSTAVSSGVGGAVFRPRGVKISSRGGSSWGGRKGVLSKPGSTIRVGSRRSSASSLGGRAALRTSARVCRRVSEAGERAGTPHSRRRASVGREAGPRSGRRLRRSCRVRGWASGRTSASAGASSGREEGSGGSAGVWGGLDSPRVSKKLFLFCLGSKKTMRSGAGAASRGAFSGSRAGVVAASGALPALPGLCSGASCRGSRGSASRGGFCRFSASRAAFSFFSAARR